MAEEKINIATLEIDVKEFVQSATVAKKELEDLRTANRDLRKAGKQGSRQFVENDVRIKELSKTYRQQTQAATALNNATKDLTEATNFEKKSVLEVTNERNNYIKLSKAIKGNTEAEREQRKKLNQIIDKQTEFIRENASSYSDNKDRIGEYRDAINSTLLGNTKVGRIINEVTEGLDGLKKAYGAATGATKAQNAANKAAAASSGAAKNAIITLNGALKLFKLALISTGIGAIVVALGTLITFLATTQEGFDEINKILRPVKEVLGETVGIIQDFGKAVFDAFDLDKLKEYGQIIKQEIMDRFSAVSKIIEGIITFNKDLVNEGIADNKKLNEDIQKAVDKSLNKIGKRYDDAIKRGERLAKLDKEIEEGQNRLILREQELRTEIKKANKDAEDTTKNLEEREAAAKRSIDASKELLNEQQAQLDKELERKQLEAEANDTSRAQQKEINELIARRSQLEEQALELQTTQTNKLNILRKQVAGEEEKRIQDRKAKQTEAFEKRQTQLQEELDLIIAQSQTEKQTIQESLKTAKDVADQKKQILKERLDQGVISETAYQTELLNIQNEFGNKQSEAALLLAEREAERQSAEIERTVLNEQEKNNRLAEVERQYQAERLEAGEISEQEYNMALDAINEENRIANKEAEMEREAINRENRLASLRLNYEQEYQIKQQQLERERQLEIQNAQKTGADVTEINAKYNKFQADLDKQLQQQKLNVAKTGLNALAGVMDKESAAGKAIAVAQSIINTQQGITAALGSAPPPINFALAAATGAAGFKAVSDIISTKKPKVQKAERGMRIGGQPHSRGGTMIEAERGEAVVNKNAMAGPLGGIVSAINEQYGGVPLAERGMRVGKFGASSKLENSLINYTRLEDSLGNALLKMKAPQVSVTEIQEKSANYTQVKERANI